MKPTESYKDYNYADYFINIEIDNLLTINRLNNAISKVGHTNRNKFAINKLLFEDIMQEFTNNDLWKELSIDQTKLVQNALTQRTITFINQQPF